MFKPLSRQRSTRSLVLFFGLMTAVLSLLAFLQYRWITEVGDAEERRLQENLNLSTSRFADEFQGQFRQLAAAFRPPGSSNSGDIVSQYLQGYEEWTAT